MFTVKEIFYTLQGEGANTGRPAVFCRFSGCNLWSGRESDRVTAICKFCDTDFVGYDGIGGGRFLSHASLVAEIVSYWPENREHRFVVLTGGEPLLQVDEKLIDLLHQHRFKVAVETNGTILAPRGVDWICVSPKANSGWIQRSGNELKLVYPQNSLLPEDVFCDGFDHYFLQPMDGAEKKLNVASAINYCKMNPKWRLSVQTHKVLEIR